MQGFSAIVQLDMGPSLQEFIVMWDLACHDALSIKDLRNILNGNGIDALRRVTESHHNNSEMFIFARAFLLWISNI